MAEYHLSSQEIRELIQRYESELHKLQFQIDRTKSTIQELKTDFASVEKSEISRAKVVEKAKPAEPKATQAPENQAEPVVVEEKKEPRKRITAVPPKPRDGQAEPVREKGRRGRPRKEAADVAPSSAENGSTTEAPGATAQPAAKAEGQKPGRKPKKAEAGKAKAKAGKSASSKSKAEAQSEERKGYRLSEFDLYIIEALTQKGHILINSDLQSFLENKLTETKEAFSPEDVRMRISRSLHKMVNRRGDLLQVSYPGRGHAYALPQWVDENGETKAKFKRK